MTQPLEKMFSGRLVMSGINGTCPDDDIELLISKYGICSFILFDRNVAKGPERLRELIVSVRRMCRQAGLPEPLFAVDQEGGAVQRLAMPHWHTILSNREAASADDAAGTVRASALDAAEMLARAGIDLNLAPVLDLSGPADKGVLKERTYSGRPEVTAELGRIYIEAIQSRGIGATAKHFPGIGDVEQDPHERRPVVDVSDEEMQCAMIPFREAVQAGVHAMMTSHVIYRNIDDKAPATFSSRIASDMLRKDAGFEGVLLTDDLEMGGVTEYDNIGEAAVRAVAAGHDLLLVCHETERVIEAVNALENRISAGEIAQARILEAVSRIESFRQWRAGFR